tara:strand:+ start:143 stop:472 length:330 start_codon:yes stop_codon:yes gene_type:complete
MENLVVGSVIYQLRNGTAEKKIIIEEVRDGYAFSDNLRFNSSYENDKITLVNQSFWLKESFGNSYKLLTFENEERFEKDIIIRFIRNSNYSKLSIVELENIEEKILSLL